MSELQVCPDRLPPWHRPGPNVATPTPSLSTFPLRMVMPGDDPAPWEPSASAKATAASSCLSPEKSPSARAVGPEPEGSGRLGLLKKNPSLPMLLKVVRNGGGASQVLPGQSV